MQQLFVIRKMNVFSSYENKFWTDDFYLLAVMSAISVFVAVKYLNTKLQKTYFNLLFMSYLKEEPLTIIWFILTSVSPTAIITSKLLDLTS